MQKVGPPRSPSGLFMENPQKKALSLCKYNKIIEYWVFFCKETLQLPRKYDTLKMRKRLL